MAEMVLMDEPERVRLALSPPRRQILDRLREPASAAQVAAELGMPRQRVGYHFRMLERAGLIELVEERSRRGCVERIMQVAANALLVDPGMLIQDTFTAIADRHAAEHLVEVAAGTVRDVARMNANAERQGVRLLTFTLEAEVRFAEPGDVHEFTDQLAAAMAQVVARFDHAGGRPYRLVAGGHPAPHRPEDQK
ncbi:transcriptional regulator [Acrocarpospora pleiomorpha]|uniref:Transcriptional regulator n=1 Tax=Acrocarpospora pleiomorpha TaxID=90975 RepID=A0A5M3XUU9_9ACTN|nr:helix-turn-helix domain-containing protein [Acrocarpospora pleiomorpha]GES24977.1 transcriptional regulator [Acrocarpospora pleiomorpha]